MTLHQVVDQCQDLPRRRSPRGGGADHRAGRCHDQGRGHALARNIADHDPNPATRQVQEVIQVSAHLTRGTIKGLNLPALDGWYFLW